MAEPVAPTLAVSSGVQAPSMNMLPLSHRPVTALLPPS